MTIEEKTPSPLLSTSEMRVAVVLVGSAQSPSGWTRVGYEFVSCASITRKEQDIISIFVDTQTLGTTSDLK